MAAPDSLHIRKVLVIYNPRAGTLLRGDREPESLLKGLFDAHHIASDLREFDADRLGDWIGEAAAEGTDAVVACGGDGSILAVVTALEGSTLPLGLIPGGTMNILARDLGIPDEIESAVAAIAAGRVRKIDLAHVNGRPFLCHSSIGLMPHLARKREHWRDLPGWLRWPRTALGLIALLRRFPRLHVRVDDGVEPRHVVTRAIAVSNNPLKAMRGPIPERASFDAGVLGIHIANDASRWTLLRIILRILAGNWKDDAAMDVSRGSSVVLSFNRPRAVSVMNDGEPVQLQTPLRYTIAPGALRVLVPDGSIHVDAHSSPSDTSSNAKTRSQMPGLPAAALPAPV